MKSLSRVQLRLPWTVAYQAPPSMGFSRQEYWSGLPFPSPVDLPDPGIKPWSPAFQADTLTSEPPGKSLNAKKQTGYPQSSESCVTHPLLKHLTEIAPMSECPRGYLIGFCSLNKYQSGLWFHFQVRLSGDRETQWNMPCGFVLYLTGIC